MPNEYISLEKRVPQEISAYYFTKQDWARNTCLIVISLSCQIMRHCLLNYDHCKAALTMVIIISNISEMDLSMNQGNALQFSTIFILSNNY